MFHCQVHWSSVPASAVPQLELTTAQRSPIPLNTASLKITSSEIIASEQSTVKQKIHIWKEQCVLIRSIWAFVLSPTLVLKTFQQHIEWRGILYLSLASIKIFCLILFVIVFFSSRAQRSLSFWQTIIILGKPRNIWHKIHATCSHYNWYWRSEYCPHPDLIKIFIYIWIILQGQPIQIVDFKGLLG